MTLLDDAPPLNEHQAQTAFSRIPDALNPVFQNAVLDLPLSSSYAVSPPEIML